MTGIKQRLLRILETEDWSAEDREWLFDYLNTNDNSVLKELMQSLFMTDLNDNTDFDDERAMRLLQAIHSKIQPAPAKVIRGKWWLRVAAAVIIVVAIGVSFLISRSGGNDEKIVKQQAPETIITPAGNKAMLTLGDGSVVVLDSMQNGALNQQGNTKVIKLRDGELAYNTSGGVSETTYNTITTPRGGQYQVTLSDGSKVWLNAASSIRFPTSFVGNERKIELTGEAYFEVAKNQSMPFKVVVAGKQEVEVLGTHFNINAYFDEASVNTTLLEGKVKVSTLTGLNVVLKPGQQSVVAAAIKINEDVNVEEVLAWKNGVFIFERADIAKIMRDISRWYDVDVVFAKEFKNNKTFSGLVGRYKNIQEVLKIIENAGVKYAIKENKVIVIQ